MDKPRFKITILFDGQGKVSGELLEDLTAIMSQYGLEVATLGISANDETVSLNSELLEQPTITDNDGNRRERKVLRFPVERQDIPDDGDII